MSSDAPEEKIIALEEGWNKVNAQITPFLDFVEHGKQEFFKAKDFVSIYDLIFQMCIQRDPYNWSEEMYNRYKEVIRRYLIDKVGPALDVASGAVEHSFLKMWVEKWANHKRIVHGLTKVFMYLDRFYTPSTDGVLKLKEQGFKLYKEEVFDKYAPTARKYILNAITRDRNKEEQDYNLLMASSRVFVEMGYNYGDNKLKVYTNDLEKYIIEHAAEHYKKESRVWMDEDSCPSYLEKVEACLQAEQQRVTQYLNQASMDPLQRACYTELLKLHQMELLTKNTGLVHLLEANRSEDLSRLFRLFQKYADDLPPIGNMLHDFIKLQGQQLVDKAQPSEKAAPADGAEDGKEAKGDGKEQKEQKVDPNADQELVKDLIALHERFATVVKECFGNNAVFQRALKGAFEDFINKDYRVSHLLAKFVNDVMKKGSKINSKDVDNILEHVVFLYGYIQDKDVFEYQYQNFLADRLLMNLCQSEHTEKTMLQKLKREAGYQWVSKLEGMFKDVSLSQKLNEDFRVFFDTEQKLGLTFDVTVCKTGFWPSSKSQATRLPDSEEVGIACDKYKNFYINKHNGHKLQWRLDQGQAEVNVDFAPTVKRTLVVSTFQMMILLVFNNVKTPTFKEMKDLTGIPDDEIQDHLLTLCHPNVKVLNKNPNTKNLTDTDRFRLNPKFTSQLRKVNIPLMQFKAGPKQIAEPPDRIHQIDAAIVRLMKTRRTMRHNNLVAEVIQQLSARFKPKPAIIKKRIESLIEQDYLKRDDNDRGSYQYLA